MNTINSDYDPRDTVLAAKYLTKRNSIYLVGSFTDWRDLFIEPLTDFNINDPRTHEQSSITRLNNADMSSAQNCDISLAYVPKEKRLGTMSFAELGASRAKGKSIIVVDENPAKHFLLEQIASHYLDSPQAAIDLINSKEYFNKYEPLEEDDKTETKKPYGSVLFAGNLGDLSPIMDKIKKTKQVYEFDSKNLDVLDDTDLIVVNFDKNKAHDEQALFVMGLGYATKTPIIELEGNPIPYPPLLGLARRVLVGKDRFNHLDFYLEHLGSQHISDEALTYYKLMKQYNLEE